MRKNAKRYWIAPATGIVIVLVCIGVERLLLSHWHGSTGEIFTIGPVVVPKVVGYALSYVVAGSMALLPLLIALLVICLAPDDTGATSRKSN